jgi:DNA-binding winged helix-turn-helix (wHTH) protein
MLRVLLLCGVRSAFERCGGVSGRCGSGRRYAQADGSAPGRVTQNRCPHSSAPSRPLTSATSRCAFEFAGFRFEASIGLSRSGREIALAPTPMRVLAALLEAQGRFVSRDDVIRAGWSGRAASNDSLSRCVYLIRQALSHPDGLVVVETAYGRGFRVAVPVRRLEGDRTASSIGRLAQLRHASAFETWVAARELAARRTPQDLLAARQILEDGLDAEPGYAPSWALLGFLSIVQANCGWSDPSDCARHALDAARRALALDPEAVDALAVRGFVRAAVLGAADDGLADLAQAVSLDAQHWLARHLQAWGLVVAGRPEAALRSALEAQALNPRGPRAAEMVATCAFFGGASPDATLHLARELAARPGAGGMTWAIAAVAASLAGAHPEALEASRRAAQVEPHCVPIATLGADVLARAGRPGDALARLAELDARWPGAALELRAPVHLALGDRAAAIRALRDGAARRGLHLGPMRADPRLAELVGDPALADVWSPPPLPPLPPRPSPAL